MAARKTYLVNTAHLNLRATPSMDGDIIAVLPAGLRVTVDPDRKAPDGWVAVDDIGYLKQNFLK